MPSLTESGFKIQSEVRAPTSTPGNLFKLNDKPNQNRQQTLHMFQASTDGANPYGGVIFDQAGNLYGTTSVLGANRGGTVFESSALGRNLDFQRAFITSPWNFEPIWRPDHGCSGQSLRHIPTPTVLTCLVRSSSWRPFTWWLDPYTDLYDFTGISAAMGIVEYPFGVVAVDTNGNLYGITVVALRHRWFTQKGEEALVPGGGRLRV